MTEGEDESNEIVFSFWFSFFLLLFYKTRTVILLHKSFLASSFTTPENLYRMRPLCQCSGMAWHGNSL